MADWKKDFANNLKIARKNAELSQSDVGKKLNLSQDTVSRWENGRTAPNIQQLYELAELLEVDVDELFPFK